jgi:hypothetical protein
MIYERLILIRDLMAEGVEKLIIDPMKESRVE